MASGIASRKRCWASASCASPVSASPPSLPVPEGAAEGLARPRQPGRLPGLARELEISEPELREDRRHRVAHPPGAARAAPRPPCCSLPRTLRRGCRESPRGRQIHSPRRRLGATTPSSATADGRHERDDQHETPPAVHGGASPAAATVRTTERGGRSRPAPLADG